VEPWGVARRQSVVKPIQALLVLLLLLVACSSVKTPDATPPSRGESLSRNEVARAEVIARQAIADQGASVSSASVIERMGNVEYSNTGHPCTSGRELQIKLIGKFPHTETTGHTWPSGSSPPDFTIRAMIITADSQSGRTCLIEAQTAENGAAQPLPGGLTLPVT
jgi:hypothetical protein